MKLWPAEAARQAPAVSEENLSVPATSEGRRNLALLPGAKAKASSVLMNGALPIHQISHLNDGWYGNSASWIADQMPAWAEIDLGGIQEVAEVRVGEAIMLENYIDRAVRSDCGYCSPLITPLVLVPPTGRPLPGRMGSRCRPRKSFRSHQPRRAGCELRFSTAGKACRAWTRLKSTRRGPSVAARRRPLPRTSVRRGPKPRSQLTLTGPGPLLCLGSKQYLDEAEKRLLANCADGVCFLMFDGNWWNGGCDNPAHGHPVPYRLEDHIRANIDLMQRIHAKYPKVLIELHDPGAGGSSPRIMPVYYKYGLPGSYDENWGFELMWDPMADFESGPRTRLILLQSPVATFPSTCTSISTKTTGRAWCSPGGTLPPAVIWASVAPVLIQPWSEAQKLAMKQYREWERFYKRGEFFGISKEIHLHALPADNAVVVNMFNLSDQPRTIEGSIPVNKMGLNATETVRRIEAVGDRRTRNPQGQFEDGTMVSPGSHFSGGVSQLHTLEA